MTRLPVAAAWVLAVAVVVAGCGAGAGTAGSAASLARVAIMTGVSSACPGQNAEPWQAVDQRTGLIYQEWIGCAGIGFAWSADGGRTYSRPAELPGSGKGWDPAVTVAADGTVYASFLVFQSGKAYPVIDISSDHGRTFPVSRSLIPPLNGNFGDRVFVAAGPGHAVYVTWDYGPVDNIKETCDPVGSCSFTSGDVNAVFQRSADGGLTWSPIIPISPGFPASGADSAPLLVEPGGRIDVLYQGYQVTDRSIDLLGVAHPYFRASEDGGRTWSAPVRIGPAAPYMTQADWWIDGSLGVDAAGGRCATWDTQSGGADTGWISCSAARSGRWSRPAKVTSGPAGSMILVQVAGGATGIFYLAWLTNGYGPGYALYLRPFSPGHGWLRPALLVSGSMFGNRRVWPGDTIGLTPLPGGRPGTRRVAVSWGSAPGGPNADSQIRAAVVGNLP